MYYLITEKHLNGDSINYISDERRFDIWLERRYLRFQSVPNFTSLNQCFSKQHHTTHE